VRPGEYRVVRWEMRNAGTVPWRDRYLYRVGRPGVGLSSPPLLPMPDTEPGGIAEIYCPVQAPSLPGAYRVCLKAGLPDGEYCHPSGLGGLILTVIVPPTDLADCYDSWSHR
jgi:hypothetical protein